MVSRIAEGSLHASETLKLQKFINIGDPAHGLRECDGQHQARDHRFHNGHFPRNHSILARTATQEGYCLSQVQVHQA